MDPYVICKVGSNKYKGKCDTDGGKKPKFNDSFNFNYKDGDLLQIEVWDKDVATDDDLIGQGALSLMTFASNPGK